MRVLLVLLVVIMFAGGCGGDVPAAALYRFAGVPSEPVRPVCVDVVVDSSGGSPGSSPDVVHEQLRLLLPVVARRSGLVRVWLVGPRVGETSVVGEAVLSRSRARNVHVREREETQTAQEAGERLIASLSQQMVSRPPRSILFESLEKVRLTGAPVGSERVIVLVSDLREMSVLLRSEDRPLPDTPDSLVVALDGARVLAPDSMRGIVIACAYFNLDPSLSRTPNTVARHVQLQELWEAVLHRAGGSVTFSSGPYLMEGAWNHD